MEQKQILDTIAMAIDQALSNLHTCTIARVTAVKAKSISCKPVFNRVVDGQSIELPVFEDVPPIILQGGSSHHAFPITVGDYCILYFTERCTDGWLNGQDYVAPLEYRMHDYSDGFALVGLNNLAGAITIPSVVQMTGDHNQDGNSTHQGDMEREGDTLLTGDIIQSGNFETDGKVTSATLNVGGSEGISGSFTTGDARTATFVNGILTALV